MGANAQTTVPTFTASQVLTADQQNQSARTGVPVFATTVTRDAAFGGTGEKTLAEGQLAYIEATDVVQYYNGTVWATLGPTSSALTFISGATFSAASSVAVDSVFTSTYQNYRVIFIVSGSATASGDTTLQYRTSGSTNTTSNYTRGLVGISSGGSFDGSFGSGGTSFALGNTSSSEANYVITLDIYRPQETTLTNAFVTNMPGYGSTTPRYGTLQFVAATAFDGFIVSRTAGTMSGNYRVYGYSNS